MVDIVVPAVRSRMMSGIRDRNTRPEMRLRRLLHAAGYRYRLHVAKLPGRPDVVLPRRKAVVFVHGCFWHRHEGCHWCTNPASNSAFWEHKLSANVSRDGIHTRTLLAEGWRVATVWECSLRDEYVDSTLARLMPWIDSDEPLIETGLLRKRGNRAHVPL